MVEADASGKGIGVVLSQNLHPIAYFSKALGIRGQAKSIYEKELMPIVLAVQKWRHYLIGRHFVIWTDQKSLKFIMEQREIGTEYQKWACKLLGYDFEIKYRPGSTNGAADALSRHPSLAVIYLTALVSSWDINWSALRKEIDDDQELTKLRSDLRVKGAPIAGFYLRQDQLLYKGRRVIPSTSSLIPKLLFEFHDSAIGGHNGEFKTYLRIAEDWYWVDMRKKVAQYVHGCPICQTQKSSHQQPQGSLNPLPIPAQVWEDISLDFVKALPKSGGFDTVLVG